MNMRHLSKELILITGIVCCLPCLAVCGEFFRAPGLTALNDGGKRVTITIAASATADKQLLPTVTWHSGDTTITHRLISMHCDRDSRLEGR